VARLPASVRELGAAAVAAAAAVAGAVAIDGSTEASARWAVACGLAGGLVSLQLALHLGRGAEVRSDRATQEEAFRYLEQRVIAMAQFADPALELARALDELLAHAAGLGQVRLYAASGDGRRLIDAGDAANANLAPVASEVALDRRARAWLQTNPRPIDGGRLSELPLGGLRQLIEELVRALGGDVMMPLVHRGQLVGVATACGNARRALRGPSLETVQAVQGAAASALDELRLRTESDKRSEVEREVERAALVQLEAGAGPMAENLAGWQLVRTFESSHQFSGSWWTAVALPGPRLLVGLGEVTGHGVPAALLAASAIGVCEAAGATLGATLEPQAVLELVHQSVSHAGGDTYRMSCFVALLDAGTREVAFAGAGHAFPYVWRAGRLGALVSRGNLLGGDSGPRLSEQRTSIAPGDVIIFHSAAATITRAPGGEVFGERRLRRLLQGLQEPAGGFGTGSAAVAEQIAGAVRAHAGTRQLDDDLLIMTASLATREMH
jgi:serine phosphatase RsbU (regulator of sigma subunit)